MAVSSHLYVGIGLWSHKYGLSEGLPVDVLTMVVAAEQTRREVKKATGKESEIFLLVADHLAVEEGAVSEEVHKRVAAHISTLKNVQQALRIGTYHIICSSDIVNNDAYKKLHAHIVEQNFFDLQQKEKILLQEHKKYVCTQTALSRYLHENKQVGLKIGWAYGWSKKRRNKRKGKEAFLFGRNFDETWFDAFYKQVYQDESLQFLYTQSGWATQKRDGIMYSIARSPYAHMSTEERKKDRRLLLGSDENPVESLGKKARNQLCAVARHMIALGINPSLVVTKKV